MEAASAIAQFLNTRKIPYKELQQPFLPPAEGCFILPAEPFRFSISLLILVYSNHLTLGVYGKGLKPEFDQFALNRNLDRNQPSTFLRYIQFNPVLSGVFTTIWTCDVQLLQNQFKYIHKSLCEAFKLAANDMSDTWVEERFRNVGLKAGEVGGIYQTDIWENRRKLKGKVAIIPLNERIKVKVQVDIPSSLLMLFNSEDKGDYKLKQNPQNGTVSLIASTPEIDEIEDLLKLLKYKFELEIVPKLLSDSVEFESISSLSVSPSPPILHKSTPKFYKLYKFPLTKLQYDTFLSKLNDCLRPYVLIPNIENGWYSFEGRKWHSMHMNHTDNQNINQWLSEQSWRFVRPPLEYIYHVKGEPDFKILPTPFPDEYPLFEVENRPVDDLDALNFEIMEFLARNFQTEIAEKTAKLIANLPITDKIEFSQFKIQNLRACDELGVGGFGNIYKNVLTLDRDGNQEMFDVALKVIRPEKMSKQSNRDSLLQEYRLLKSFSHKNIVQVYGYTIAPETHSLIIVSELCSKESLHRFILKNANISMLRRLKLIKGLASGLVCLHSRGMAHLDLKPQNILVNMQEIAKISDFGLSKQKLKPGVKTGYTLLYSAPEQLEAKEVSISSDIWAFGNVMYFILFSTAPNDRLKDPTDNAHSFQTKTKVISAITKEKKRPLLPSTESMRVFESENETKREKMARSMENGMEIMYPKLIDLMRMCWMLDPAARPTAKKILSVVRKECKREKQEFLRMKQEGDRSR